MPLSPLHTTRRSSGSLKYHGSTPPERSRNVFLQGLPVKWNTDKLRTLCGTCGKVELAKVVRDSTTSMSCGHGFVLFETEEQALACVATLNGFVVDGHTLTCRLAREKLNLSTIAAASKVFSTMTSMQLLHLSARDLAGCETVAAPAVDFVAPHGVLHAVPSSLPANLVPLVNCGNWPAVGVMSACPAASGGGGGQYAGVPSASFSHQTRASLLDPPQTSCASVPTTAGIIQAISPQSPEFVAVTGVKCHLAQPRAFGNTYVVAVPITPTGARQAFNAPPTSVGGEAALNGGVVVDPFDCFYV